MGRVKLNRRFNKPNIEEVIREEDVEMLFDVDAYQKYGFELNHLYGLWVADQALVIIRSGQSRKEEDVTIAHEWGHVIEEYRCSFKSTEKQIEDQAYNIRKKKPHLVQFIRSFYRKEGF